MLSRLDGRHSSLTARGCLLDSVDREVVSFVELVPYKELPRNHPQRKEWDMRLWTAMAVGWLAAIATHALQAGEPVVPPILFACEGQSIVILFAPDGRVAWDYPAEMSRDVWRLPNGNTLFCYNRQYDSRRNDNPSGVMEVSPDRRVVFHFQMTGQVWSCQRLADGNTLVGAASQGKLLIVDPAGRIAAEIKLRNTPGHSCLRNARQIAGGHFLVAEESAHAAREYAADGQMVREIKVNFPPYSAVRLPDGHTLVCGAKAMVEVDTADRVVWSLTDGDVASMGVRWMAGLQVLPGGNVLVCNAGGKVPLFEVNRQKQIVWHWPASAPHVAIGHGIQRLDVPGDPIK
jgi:hypothetical protein